MKVKVLFVCLGNICRSPLAEGVFQHYVRKRNGKVDILCDSAGTAGYHIGSSPDKRSSAVAKKHGIELVHAGRKLEKADFDQFDYILAMDIHNYQDIVALQKGTNGKAVVKLFREFDPLGTGDVPDPYHGTEKDFMEVYTMCDRSCENLYSYILGQYPNG